MFQRAKNWASSLDELDTPIETYSDYCPTVAAGKDPVHGFTYDENCVSTIKVYCCKIFYKSKSMYMNNFTNLRNSVFLFELIIKFVKIRVFFLDTVNKIRFWSHTN